MSDNTNPEARAFLRERIERRLTWLREWHKLDPRPFVDGDGKWSAFDFCNDVERYLAFSQQEAPQGEPFQARVQPWMMACFGELIAGDREERNHRFLEEALELVQACGCTASEAHQLVDYVFGRDIGEPAQEVGGVMVTLAALCLASGLDMHASGETELARIWTKVDAIRAKQAAKPKHSPLPQEAPTKAQGVEGGGYQPMLPAEVLDFVSQACLLSTNHGGWFDSAGFRAISPLNVLANAILERYAAQPASPSPDPLLSEGEGVGTAQDAIDFALGCSCEEADTFLRAWSQGRLDEWPEYLAALHRPTQGDGADPILYNDPRPIGPGVPIARRAAGKPSTQEGE